MSEANLLTSGDISRQIRRIGIPVGIGVLFNNLFQVVDTFYAGEFSREALAALALSFPIYFIIIGLASGLGTGASALIGNALGAGEREEAVHYAAQGITLTVLLGLLTATVGIAVSPRLYQILGAAGDGVGFNMSYITPIFQATVCFNLVFMFHAALSAQGETRPFRNFLILGFALNIFLDPWFIYGGWGMPAMGVAGVGAATALVQLMGSFVLGWRALRSPLFADFKPRMLIPDIRRALEIVKQGAPPALDLSTVSIGAFIVTYFISRFGTDVVAAYGVASRLDGLFWIPLVGLDVATLVLVAQNNGARRYRRMWQAHNTALRYGLILMLIGGGFVFVFAYQLISIFTDETAIIEIGVVYLRISALAYWAKPLGFIGFAALRGIKRPLLPMTISMTRMIILPAILLYALVILLGAGLLSIWWTTALITIVSGFLAWFFVQRLMPREGAKAEPSAL